MDTDITLADLLSRSISLEWFEGVALVREVIDRLGEHPERSTAVPELAEIRLAPEGSVRISGRAHADEPVRRLGQLLQAVLVRTELPVQLRLIIAKATAPEPGFDSVDAFGEALAYFERPQRASVLQRLYERACASPPAATDRSETLDSVAPLPARAAAPRSERKIESRTLRRVAATLAIVVVAFAAAVQFARVRGSKETQARIAAAARRLSAVAADGVIAGVSAVTERVGLGRVVPADAPATPAVAPPEVPAVPASPHNARRVAATAGELEPPFAAFDLEPHRAEEPAPPADAVAAAADAVANAPAAAPVTAAVVETSPDTTTYTAASEGVSPPIAIRPQLPTALPSTINAESLSRIEIVVDTHGLVESVRLLGRVPSVKDKMFLSVAKAWQFQPATKSGKAVKYRKTVWLADQ